jgi:drug/metabolite transporter (DMT)-like permease
LRAWQAIEGPQSLEKPRIALPLAHFSHTQGHGFPMTLPVRSTQAQSNRFVFILVAATFLMGSSFVAGKVLLAAGFLPLPLVGWRFFVAALATLPLVLVEHRAAANPATRAMQPRDWAVVVTIGLLQTSAVMCLLFVAMRTISASAAAILLFTNPIWVALLGKLFLKESLNRQGIAGLFLGIVGVALALRLGPATFFDSGAVAGELTALGSALCWACATIINKRAQLPLRNWALSFWQMLIGSVVVLALSYSLGEHWPATTTPVQWTWFFWLAIPASTGSFGLWFLALAMGGATRTSAYLFLAPLFAVILSYLILDTTLSWLQGVGGILIGLSLWLVNRETPAGIVVKH